MPAIPFAIQWIIPENRLLQLKESINGSLASTKVTHIPNFKYCLQIYPNGHDDDSRGRGVGFLHLEFNHVNKIDVNCTFTLKSANISAPRHYIYENSCGQGIFIGETEDFFDPKKKFIVNEKFIIKVNGIFEYDIKNDPIPFENGDEQKWEGGELGNELWENEKTKDITIVVSDDGEEIKVHKFILQNRFHCSPFYSKMIETNEDEMEITDFSFTIVEIAMKIFYNCNCVTSLTMDELMSLLKFFDIFELPFFKKKVEPFLMPYISVLNVCRLTNCSVSSTAETLKNKCIEFIMNCIKSKTAISHIEDLDKDAAFRALQIYVGQISEDNDVPVNLKDQKWEGGELGNELWENHETKDFTIETDEKEIKIHKLLVGVRSQFFAELFNSASGNSVEISEFTFYVVETAFKIIYDCNFVSSLTVDDLMLLSQFFDKYNLPSLKDKVEPHLIEQISVFTVCRLTNCSILTNSKKLKEKCMEFLTKCVESKTALRGIESLDKNIAFEIIQNAFYTNLETR